MPICIYAIKCNDKLPVNMYFFMLEFILAELRIIEYVSQCVKINININTYYL